ncbi:type II toxin-antitoxin system RelE/ParE family toxin [Brumimicrobium sp.]|uniref:type II toxin-antitoxin system RelE/ParE family toxin n=1 Tax=Brumimicrobium sp. TaxID=2029867 RepID=UPI00261F2BB3|nr:type II toxin-antitoxin system RelE/ParE family toxin [uncultured Brumimicrobium sp.]
MESGYNIFWTDHALSELADTYEYLELNFTPREMKNLSLEIDQVLQLISKKPKLFPISESLEIRKVVIKKYNTMYYKVNKNQIEIISFFSNRQSPERTPE